MYEGMKVKGTAVQKKLLSILVTVLIVFSLLTNTFIITQLNFMPTVSAGNISSVWYNETTINVTVIRYEPRILWYGFQYNDSGTWVSKRNAQIDVDNSSEYRFIVNISSDQGWDDIEFINITAWHDNGSESTTYNQTKGGNLNLYFQYENLTGNANYSYFWPDNEITTGTSSEITVVEASGAPGYTETRNISFSFIPGCQFRYAPGPGSWTKVSNFITTTSWASLNNTWSWNFNITVTDSGENNSDEKLTSYATDEFGVYSYSEIVSSGWPTILGTPNTLATADSDVSIVTRSNGNYSLSVLVDDLVHTVVNSITFSNETLWLQGGDLDTSTNFSSGGGPLYYYGSLSTYHVAENNDTSKTTSDLEYKCQIPLGQQTGVYNATIHYNLKTQI
jgi:hypothetical protein